MRTANRILVAGATALVLGALPDRAAAQLVSLGSGSTSTSTTAAAVAYDPAHDAYLVARPGAGASAFADGDGNLDGPSFTVTASGASLHAVYSADVSDGAGGTGGFLITWTDPGPFYFNVHAQIVAYPGRLVGPPVTVYQFTNPQGSGIFSTAAAYSPTERVFLVAMGVVVLHVNSPRFVRLDLAGQPLGGIVLLPGAGFPHLGMPSLGMPSPGASCGVLFHCGEVHAVWNAASQEFGILQDGPSLGFSRVRADGTIMGQVTLGSSSGAHALAVNAARGTYFLAATDAETHVAEIDVAGKVVGRQTVSPRSTYWLDSRGLALAYSPAAKGFALDVFGLVLTLDDGGAPTGSSFDTGAWNAPAVAGSSRGASWVVTFPSGFLGLGFDRPLVERGDFSGDGRADVMWQHPDTGAVLLWTMNGASYAGSTILNAGGTLWRLAGSADFSADGKPDLLWQDPANGALLLWTMDGHAYVRSTLLTPGGTDWRVAAVADLTVDGSPDIVWQHPLTGAVLLWTMYGGAYISSTFLNPGTTWQVVGAADFTGDLQTDLLWQDPASGALLLWQMNGSSYGSSTMLSPGGTCWKAAAVADYTGDGSPDILWQHPADGAVLLWEMDGVDYVSSIVLNGGGTLWQIRAPR